jgi:hypothetical protein
VEKYTGWTENIKESRIFLKLPAEFRKYIGKNNILSICFQSKLGKYFMKKDLLFLLTDTNLGPIVN